MNLSLDQYATLFNITGVMVVLGLSLAPLRLLTSSFYRRWALAYFICLIVIVVEFVASLVGRSGGISYVSVALIALGALQIANTAWSLRRGALAPRRILLVWGVVCLLAFAGLAAGLSFLQVAMLPALGLAMAFIWLGAEVFLTRRASGERGAIWLAAPLVAFGAWQLTYSAVTSSTMPWLGYWVSGLLNLWVGAGMLVYLLLETAEDLKRSNTELKSVNALKNNFLYTISHEIRAPLTAIRAASALLDHGTVEERERLKAMVETNSVQLDRMLGDILDFAKMEAKVLSFDLEALDLGDVVLQACDAFGPLMSQQDIMFVVDVQDDTIPVYVDRERIHQVISNLLSNAMKFTPSGGHVTLGAVVEDGMARVVVRDTGIGIAEDLTGRVFEKFFQVDGGISRRYGGAGLGLSIAKMIIEEGHRGQIRLNSVEGQGSEFIVELPLR